LISPVLDGNTRFSSKNTVLAPNTDIHRLGPFSGPVLDHVLAGGEPRLV